MAYTITVVDYSELRANHQQFFTLLEQDGVLQKALKEVPRRKESMYGLLGYSMVNFRSFWLWMMRNLKDDTTTYRMHILQELRYKLLQSYNSHKGDDLYVDLTFC